MNRYQKSLSRHFTLIEVMISIVIIGTSLMSLLFIRNNAIEDIAVINENRVLRILAEKKIAELEMKVEENEAGDFSDEGYPEFRWEAFQEQIEITNSSGANEESEGESPSLEDDEEDSSFFLNKITLTIEYGSDGSYELVVFGPVEEDEDEEGEGLPQDE